MQTLSRFLYNVSCAHDWPNIFCRIDNIAAKPLDTTPSVRRFHFVRHGWVMQDTVCHHRACSTHFLKNKIVDTTVLLRTQY